MGTVNHLQQFHVPFDAEQFIQSHKDCPQDVPLLDALWKMVHPAVFWREELIAENDGVCLRLYHNTLCVQSCYVAKGLAQCSRATVLALTIGSALPQFAANAAAEGRLYEAAVADYLGSHAVELFADAFCAYLQQQALPKGMYATLRYSPGYGDWALSAQPDIFQFLNGCRNKIQLSENYLMEPVKSITAIMGWSDKWQKPEYPHGEHNAFCNGGHNCAACVTWACRKVRNQG
ncbi:MAG: hypothetical protein J6B76_08215 [Peptococcaceae bacterium]|nr:hypothetical protein [Peptococcaceae bacterium]